MPEGGSGLATQLLHCVHPFMQSLQSAGSGSRLSFVRLSLRRHPLQSEHVPGAILLGIMLYHAAPLSASHAGGNHNADNLIEPVAAEGVTSCRIRLVGGIWHHSVQRLKTAAVQAAQELVERQAHEEAHLLRLLMP